MARLAAALLAFFVLLTPAFLDGKAWAAPNSPARPNFPQLSGRVVDDAHILSPATQADLTQKLEVLEKKTARQLVVVTLSSLQGYEISDYGYQLGRAWGIGQKAMNNGILFIVAPHERRTRIEVGYGLEPIVTDALSSVIIQTQVLPKFRQGDFDGGVRAGAGALIEQLSLDLSEAEKRAAAAQQQLQQSGDDHSGGIGLIVALVIIFFILRMFGGWGLLPLIFMGGGGRHRGGFGGSGWSGGGGFGGGGGSFGGGGSSGSW
ncbi:MAG TPA: TPM domain-containing protein [Rhizomicrobium sp.]|nr:TPM domain-containing protein [Rhizomicrobium sp.]